MRWKHVKSSKSFCRSCFRIFLETRYLSMWNQSTHSSSKLSIWGSCDINHFDNKFTCQDSTFSYDALHQEFGSEYKKFFIPISIYFNLFINSIRPNESLKGLVYKSLSKSSLSASLVKASESEKSKSSRLLLRQHVCW